jgi:hypothetical protein
MIIYLALTTEGGWEYLRETDCFLGLKMQYKNGEMGKWRNGPMTNQEN